MKERLSRSYHKLRETNILSNFLNLGSIQVSNTLLIILLIPVITRKIGIAEFGIVMFASRFSQLAGTVINYGTNQSGVRDIAANVGQKGALEREFYNTLNIRSLIFILYLVTMAILYLCHISYYNYVLLSMPIVLAEVFNPLFFFIGVERLKIFNIANLLSNIVCIVVVLLFIKGPQHAAWVNFIMGMANALTYLALLIYATSSYSLNFTMPSIWRIAATAKSNFYLTVNNISVQLQQSIIIFALTGWGNTAILGAYSLCDRIIGQCRNLLITISNAIYPNAVKVYAQGAAQWNLYRRKMKYLITGVFFCGSVILFTFADFIIYLLAKEHNATAVIFLRIMAIVPTLSALNVLNVLDQLLKNLTVAIFRIAIILLIVAVLITLLFQYSGHYQWIGSFTLIIEASAWLMYEYIVKKTSSLNE